MEVGGTEDIVLIGQKNSKGKNTNVEKILYDW